MAHRGESDRFQDGSRFARHLLEGLAIAERFDDLVVALCKLLTPVSRFEAGRLLVLVREPYRLWDLKNPKKGGVPVEPPAAFLSALRRRKAAAKRDPAFLKYGGRLGSRLVLPLFCQGSPVGVLFLARRARKPFADEVEILEKGLAPTLASALVVVDRLEKAGDLLARQALLTEASRRIRVQRSIQSLASEAVKVLASVCGLDAAAWYSPTLGGKPPELVANCQEKSTGRIPACVRDALSTARRVAAGDQRTDGSRVPRTRGLSSEMALPLLEELGSGTAPKVLGMLHLGAKGAFRADWLILVEAVVSELTVAARNLRQAARQERSRERFRALLRTTRDIAGAVDSDNVLDVIASEAKRLLKAKGCTIYKLLDDGRTLKPVLSKEPRYQRQIMKTTLEVGTGIVGSVVAAGHGEVINHGESDPRARHVPGTIDSKRERLMVSPLAARGRIIGAMRLSRTLEHFTPEDLDTFTIFAGLTAEALFIADLHAKMRRTRDFLERVVDSSVDAIVTTDLSGGITFFSKGAETLFGYQAAEVMGKPVYDYYVHGREEGKRVMQLLRRLDQVVNYEIQFVAKGGAHISCIMSASLLRDAGGKPIGTLGISKDITERVYLERRLRELSNEDSLTGLYNDRHFWDSLRYEVRRAKRQKSRLALIMFDLDGFKNYNDTRGHLAGDDALVKVGEILRSAIREDIDKGFRYGGDEFVALLPGAGKRVARRIARRIREGVPSITDGRISVSAGLVVLMGGNLAPRRFVQLADKAMYRAKEQGGDCIVEG